MELTNTPLSTSFKGCLEPHAPLASCRFNFKIVHPQSHDVINVEASLLLQHKADVSD